ncbi:MAG: aldose 1-epimerase family protein [Sphingomonas sp.]
MIEISSGALSASIDPFGAELVSLRDAEGRALMTDADPAFWTGRAPILFPIVGTLNGDRYRVQGREYALPRHGFARRMMFEPVETGPERACLRLTDTAATRAAYPWPFTLLMEFAIEDLTLRMSATIHNTGDATMYASFGFHPAFAWPLPYGHDRADHRITFDHDMPGPLRALDADGLIAGDRPSPLDGRVLHLSDALFAHDALIWDPAPPLRLLYGASEGPLLIVESLSARQLGIWTRPGARFLCIEPWNGIADPAGYGGEFADKPGVLALEPNGVRHIEMKVSLDILRVTRGV